MPSIRNIYHKQDRDTGLNEREIAQANVKQDKPIHPSYFEARNFRPYSTDALTKQALNNFKGTVEKIDLTSSFIYYNPGDGYLHLHWGGLYADHVIIGAGKIRDRTVFISTNNTGDPDTGGETAIWSTFLNAPSGLTPQGALVRHWIGSLGYSTQYPVVENIESRYESEDIQKIYFTDGYHNLHYCNVAMSYMSTLLTQTAAEFEIIHPVTLNKPTLSIISSGNLNTGMVQYAYRYYKLNGPETVFSPSSELIPLTIENETASNSSLFRGQSQLDETGNTNKAYKSITMDIANLDQDFDRIEIVAIHYTTEAGDPTIHIVSRFNVTGTSMTFIDTGNYTLGTYTLNEFRTLGGLLFSCKTLSAKENKLFPGNINQKNFDVDFDCRAYRFFQSGGLLSRLCVLQTENLVPEYTINGTSPGTTGGSQTSWNAIPETADAFNAYNNPDNDGIATTKMIYQTNGTTIGGEGPNIQYTFDVDSVELDDNSYIENMKTRLQGTAANPSFASYASPYIKTLKLGYTRDEVYRLAIVFGNDKGQESWPKWMGDIRMPRMEDARTLGGSVDYFRTFNMETYGPYARPLYLKIQLKSMPADATYWRVVRAERKDKDKMIASQGFVGRVRVGTDINYRPGFNSLDFCTFFNVSADTSLNPIDHSPPGPGKFCCFQSPEINFYKNLSVVGDSYLEVVGTCAPADFEQDYIITDSKYVGYIGKLKDIVPLPLITSNYSKTKILTGEIFEPYESEGDTESTQFNYLFSSREINNNISTKDWYHGGNYNQVSVKGTCMVVDLQSTIANPVGRHNDYVIANFKRHIVQYNGRGYQARQSTEWIPCSDIFTSTLSNEDIWGGDTYIAYFDHLYGMCKKITYNDVELGGQPVNGDYLVGSATILYLPVETTINLHLRHDDCYHRINGSIHRPFLRERGNSIETTWLPFGFLENLDSSMWDSSWANLRDVNISWSDLYLYNTVYSKENNSKIAISEPLDYIAEEIDDVRVIASREKKNLEERDSWLRYDTDEDISLDSQYGPLEQLVTFKNHLLFFQHDGVGTLSVNERALLQGVTAAALELGTGQVLDRYDMLATNTGVQAQGRVVQSPRGFYWWDVKRSEFQRYSGSLMDIGRIKGADSWFQSIGKEYIEGPDFNSANIMGAMIGYDPTYKEVVLLRKDDSTTGEAMIFNEMKDEFVGIVDYGVATMFFNNNHQFFALNQNNKVDELNVGDYNTFFGITHNPKIIYILNPLKEMVCVFNTFEFANEIYDVGGNNLVDAIPETIKMSNDYQDSGYVVQTSGSNIKRRMRTWRFIDFRDGSNARMRDTYLKLELTFNGSNYGKIVMHPLTCHYMVPAESLA